MYNTRKKESFWKIPEELKSVVEQFERREKERQEAVAEAMRGVKRGSAALEEEESEEEEEGSEEEEEESDEEDENPAKRLKTGQEATTEPGFTDEDIAYQLQAMGADYGGDPGEYGEDVGYEDGGEELTEDDAKALFKDLLDEHNVNPYNTWDKVIEEGKIVDDDRYTVLNTGKARRELWAEWSRERIQKLREEKERAEKRDVGATLNLPSPGHY